MVSQVKYSNKIANVSLEKQYAEQLSMQKKRTQTHSTCVHAIVNGAQAHTRSLLIQLTKRCMYSASTLFCSHLFYV